MQNMYHYSSFANKILITDKMELNIGVLWTTCNAKWDKKFKHAKLVN